MDSKMIYFITENAASYANKNISGGYAERNAMNNILVDFGKYLMKCYLRDGQPLPDTEANDNKHDVIKSVCPECKEPHKTDTKTTEQICLNCGNGWQTVL